MSEWMSWIDGADVLGWWLLACLVVGLLVEPLCWGASRADEEREQR